MLLAISVLSLELEEFSELVEFNELLEFSELVELRRLRRTISWATIFNDLRGLKLLLLVVDCDKRQKIVLFSLTHCKLIVINITLQ